MNVLVAFTLCVSAVTLVLLARPLVGYRTRVTNVWWIWGTRALLPPCSVLDFLVVQRVLKVVSSYEAKAQPAPKDMVAWLRNNPNLDTQNPQETTVGGINGVQFEATPSHVPQEYMSTCIDVCLPLFEDPEDTSQHFSLYEGDKVRFIVLEDVEGTQLIVAFHSQADEFDEFLPHVQEVLETARWEEGE